jgi:hypothetical protein
MSAVQNSSNPPSRPPGSPDGWDVVHGVLDVAGFVPGLGAVPDLLNAGLYAVRGDLGNAALSAAAAVPLFGDAAKGTAMAVKAGRGLAVDAGEAAVKRAVREGGDDGLGRALGTGQPYEALVRGEKVTLDGVTMRSVEYVKRARDEAAELRKAFDGGERKDFLVSLASDPGKAAALREAGFSPAEIERIAAGRVPQGWQVHHKLPLDDGGTNDFGNLVLIKNDPYHIAVTNTQRTLTGHLEPGGAARVEWPMIPGFVYPAKPGVTAP